LLVAGCGPLFLRKMRLWRLGSVTADNASLAVLSPTERIIFGLISLNQPGLWHQGKRW